MKRTSILYALLIVLLLPACYDDLGNYDYHEINELEVDSIHPLYNVDIDDSLCIYPTLKGTMYSDTNRFTYQWEIGAQTVGTSHEKISYLQRRNKEFDGCRPGYGIE